MKKILLSIFTLAVVGTTAKVGAQCTVSNAIINIGNDIVWCTMPI